MQAEEDHKEGGTVELVIGDLTVRVGPDVSPAGIAQIVRANPGDMMPAGARVFVATKPVDFRKGPASLMALVEASGADPFSGALYVFCAKRADRVKIVLWTAPGCASSRTRS